MLAPAELTQGINDNFKELTIKIAGALKLNGIMDVEVILHDKTLKVLEIDARLPSQTPTAVYQSTGINFLEILYDIFGKKIIPNIPSIHHENAVIYEHIKVSSGTLEIRGEHIISNAGSLTPYEDFFGSDETLTDFSPGCTEWVAILIMKERNREDVWKKHINVIKNIINYFNLTDVCFKY